MRNLLFISMMLLVSMRLSAVETHLYAQRDTCSLYLDIHRPAAGSDTVYQGVRKPTILYVFGGGFVSGARNDAYLLNWFRTLNDNGYIVVAIDYRLGMKGYKMGKGLIGIARSVQRFHASQQMGVEDVFAAVRFLTAHPELHIDTDNMVIAGNSAGAIISLASAYAIANGTAENLPAGFRFRGVMSFAGGIISLNGAPVFAQTPCPILFFHGTDDQAVAYKHLDAFGKGIWGSQYLVSRLKKTDAVYCFYKFPNRAHDVAAYMNLLWREEAAFLERNVMQGDSCIIDATISSPAFPVWKEWGNVSVEEMYKGD